MRLVFTQTNYSSETNNSSFWVNTANVDKNACKRAALIYCVIPHLTMHVPSSILAGRIRSGFFCRQREKNFYLNFFSPLVFTPLVFQKPKISFRQKKIFVYNLNVLELSLQIQSCYMLESWWGILKFSPWALFHGGAETINFHVFTNVNVLLSNK